MTSEKFEEKSVEGCNTPADLLCKLANSKPDLNVITLINKFLRNSILRELYGD